MRSTELLGTKQNKQKKHIKSILGYEMRAQRHTHTHTLIQKKEAEQSARNHKCHGTLQLRLPPPPKNASGANGSWQRAQLAASAALD